MGGCRAPDRNSPRGGSFTETVIMEPTPTPPAVPSVPQMRPLPQPPATTKVAGATVPPVGSSDESPTVDEAPGGVAVQLSIWQHPFVQNVLPFITSLMFHAAVVVIGIATWQVVKVTQAKAKEQVIIPEATMSEGPEGGIPHPGLGGDPNRDAAQDQVLNVPPDSQGINDKQGKDLSQTLAGG